MKKHILTWTVCAICWSGMTMSSAFAYTIDGNLGDWGVTPYTDWVPDSGTADWKEENNVAPPPSGVFLEAWDIEAMYFDNNDDYLFFAMVVSKQQNSGWGDLAIDLNGDGVDEFGVDLTHFGLTNNPINRDVYAVTSWDTVFFNGKEYIDPSDGKALPFRIGQGTDIGDAQVAQKLIDGHPNAYFSEPGVVGLNYVIEGQISVADLGLVTLCNLPIELTYAKFSCLRDYMRLNGTCTGNCGEIPEPATVFLLASGLLGLGGFHRRKRA